MYLRDRPRDMVAEVEHTHIDPPRKYASPNTIVSSHPMSIAKETHTTFASKPHNEHITQLKKSAPPLKLQLQNQKTTNKHTSKRRLRRPTTHPTHTSTLLFHQSQAAYHRRAREIAEYFYKSERQCVVFPNIAFLASPTLPPLPTNTRLICVISPHCASIKALSRTIARVNRRLNRCSTVASHQRAREIAKYFCESERQCALFPNIAFPVSQTLSPLPTTPYPK